MAGPSSFGPRPGCMFPAKARRGRALDRGGDLPRALRCRCFLSDFARRTRRARRGRGLRPRATGLLGSRCAKGARDGRRGWTPGRSAARPLRVLRVARRSLALRDLRVKRLRCEPGRGRRKRQGDPDVRQDDVGAAPARGRSRQRPLPLPHPSPTAAAQPSFAFQHAPFMLRSYALPLPICDGEDKGGQAAAARLRVATAAARRSRSSTVVSQSTQASVMLWP